MNFMTLYIKSHFCIPVDINMSYLYIHDRLPTFLSPSAGCCIFIFMHSTLLQTRQFLIKTIKSYGKKSVLKSFCDERTYVD